MSIAAGALSIEGRSIRFPVTRWLLYLLILSFPFFSIQPVLFRPDWWVGALLVLAFGLSILLKGRLRLDPIGKAALGLHAAVLLSVVVNFWGWGSPQWTEFTTLWLQLVFATLLYLALANLKLSERGLRSLLRLWIFVAGVVALYGLYQVLARNLGWPLAYLPYLHGEVTLSYIEWGLGFAGYVRPSSFLREPTYLGNYLLAPMLITGILFFYRQDQIWLFRRRWVNGLALALMFGAWIATLAMAAYLTLAALIVISLLLGRRVRKPAFRIGLLLILIGGLIAIAAVLLGLPFINALVERGVSIAATLFGYEQTRWDASTLVRFHEAILSIKVWAHYPLFGIGLNQLQFVGKEYIPETWPSYANVGFVHNIWLEVLVQAGMVGFIFFTAMWIIGLRMMYKITKYGHIYSKMLALSMFFILLATILRGFMGGPFTFTAYWFYLGLSSLIYHIYRRGRRNESSGSCSYGRGSKVLEPL